MSTGMVIVVIIAVVAVAFAAWMYFQKRRTETLRSRFGPEYDRLVQAEGGRRSAESTLEKREKRMDKIQIRSLRNGEVEQFSKEWGQVQAMFVDDPRMAVERADRLVQQVMQTRGYPMADFDQRAADISVDHPHVVENYRSAHAIAQRDRDGKANTEDLRQAMVHYRALFEDLLGTHKVHEFEKVGVH